MPADPAQKDPMGLTESQEASLREYVAGKTPEGWYPMIPVANYLVTLDALRAALAEAEKERDSAIETAARFEEEVTRLRGAVAAVHADLEEDEPELADEFKRILYPPPIDEEE